MNKKGDFFVWLLTIPLLAYSALRNLDLILSTMGSDAGQVVAGVGALAALDGGVLLWLMAFNHARGHQRSIAALMIIIDLFGAGAGLLADTLLKANSGQHDLIAVVAWWAIPVIIVANFGAGIIYHMSDPDRHVADRQRELDDLLKERLADALAQNSGEIVGAAIPLAVKHRQQEAVSHFLAQHANQAKSSNGHTPAPDMATLNEDGQPIAEPPKSGRKR